MCVCLALKKEGRKERKKESERESKRKKEKMSLGEGKINKNFKKQ